MPSLHVVARERTTLLTLLNEHLGGCVRISQHLTVPPIRMVGSADVLIVDLDDPQHQPVPRNLLPFLDRQEIWLAYGNGSVSAQWLEAARWPNLHFVHCDTMNRAAGLRTLVASLVKKFLGPPGDEIAGLVLAREQRLRSVDQLVRAICANPWKVRHPSQLAATVRVGLSSVKRSVSVLGFARVEHFITYVRWSAFEQLVGNCGLRVPVAQHLTGIADRSNQRRQLDRLRRGSPSAVRALQGLIASVVFVLVSTPAWT